MEIQIIRTLTDKWQVFIQKYWIRKPYGVGQITTSSTLPTGLDLSTDYHVIRIDANTYQLISSQAVCIPLLILKSLIVIKKYLTIEKPEKD